MNTKTNSNPEYTSESLNSFMSRQQRAYIGRSVPTPIINRWYGRVMAEGFRGEQGGRDYLAKYGRGIGVQKCLDLAEMATRENAHSMAVVFYCKAATLMGIRLTTKVEVEVIVDVL